MKEEFVHLLEEFIENIDKIDNKVPWSVTEPPYWLKMTDIQTKAYEILKELSLEYK